MKISPNEELIYYKQTSPLLFWFSQISIFAVDIGLIIYFYLYGKELLPELGFFGGISSNNIFVGLLASGLLVHIYLLPKILKRRAYIRQNPVFLSISNSGLKLDGFGFLDWSEVKSFEIKTKSRGEDSYKYLAINVSEHLDLGEEKKMLGLIREKKTSLDIVEGSINMKLSDLASKLDKFKQTINTQ